MSPAPNISQRGVPAAVGRVLHSGRVWTIQGVGTVAWLALAYGCIRLGRSGAWRLAGSALLALFLAYLAAFLQRTALRVYRRERLGEVMPGNRRGGVRHRKSSGWVPDAAIVFALFMALVGWNAVILQWLPDSLLGYAWWIEVFVAWFLFIIFWLPLAASALLGQRSIWQPAARAWKRPGYWLGTLASTVMCLLVLISVVSQSDLIHWLEGASSMNGQMMALLALGFAIALGAWLVILAMVEESVSSVQPRSPDDTWD
jgi:hypothetical protein